MKMKLNKIIRGIRLPVATLIIAALIILVYVVLADFEFFIAAAKFNKYAFSIFLNPANFINYVFVHTGPVHLVGDVILLIFFGLVAEQMLGRKDIFILFLVCGIVGGIVFTYMLPSYMIVGSSAGVYGLLGAAIMMRPKEAIIIAVVISLVVPYLVVPFVNAVEISVKDAIRQEALSKTQTVSQTKTQLSESQQMYLELSNQLADLTTIREALLAEGKDTTFIDEQIAQVEAALKKLDEEAKALQEKYATQRSSLQTTMAREKIYVEGLAREGSSPVAMLSHTAALICGALYIAVFRREKVYNIFGK